MLPFAVCLEGDQMWPTLGSWILETWGSRTCWVLLLVLKEGEILQCCPYDRKSWHFQLLVIFIYFIFTNLVTHRAWRHSMSCVPNLSISCVPVYFLIHGPMLNDFCFYFPWWSGQRMRIILWKWKLLDPKGEQGLWEPDTQLREQGSQTQRPEGAGVYPHSSSTGVLIWEVEGGNELWRNSWSTGWFWAGGSKAIQSFRHLLVWPQEH